ncbi:MAG: M23 family metallopeptidase [Clostridiales bacterium]|jgi:hypothetical protein|nr:M23 family metallopeptidase [Clostridiales bacterium]
MRRLRKHRRSPGNRAATLKLLAAPLALILLCLLLSAPRVKKSDVCALKMPGDAILRVYQMNSRHGLDFAELLAIYCFENKFFPDKSYDFSEAGIDTIKYGRHGRLRRSVRPYYEMFQTLLSEIECFPLETADSPPYIYGDSWGTSASMTGCIILDRDNSSGRLLTRAMSAGAVESTGRDSAGGFRVTILTSGGTRFIYSRLSALADGIRPGAQIPAGAPVGFIGRGGKARNPAGAVVSISLKTRFGQIYINPYPFLRYIESTGRL